LAGQRDWLDGVEPARVVAETASTSNRAFAGSRVGPRGVRSSFGNPDRRPHESCLMILAKAERAFEACFFVTSVRRGATAKKGNHRDPRLDPNGGILRTSPYE